MISTKKHIQQLAATLHQKGINDIIISPGSRNGPLIHTFVGSGKFNCRNIVDERSAAYFAIGLSQALQKPVVLVCSSGTAALNYAPAVAEAFYLKVPLLVITADRPEYWINQGESQCIPQKNIFADYTKLAHSLPLGESDAELWHSQRICNECINIASNNNGPVHINIPLEEPLHDLSDEVLPVVKTIDKVSTKNTLTQDTLVRLSETIVESDKILILAGQQAPDTALEKMVSEWSKASGAVVLHEHLSNFTEESFCGNIDALMASILTVKNEDFSPNLLISFGGQFVSKSLKQFLRKNAPIQHWHLSTENDYHDTYQCLSKLIPCEPSEFFLQVPKKQDTTEKYWQDWKQQEEKVIKLRNLSITQSSFSDLKVHQQILSSLPANSVVHLGNSSPVRYALICKRAENVEYYSNRGTSGIDGCLSTAVGYASARNKTNTVILGDLSFFYDSNALWNKYLSKNLRIIVVNNAGGNIFGLIKGPSNSEAFEEHFLARHTNEAKGLAMAYGIEYFKVQTEIELNEVLPVFYKTNSKGPRLLEIFTEAEVNTKEFRSLFQKVKN
jgi:2-succinyl-5-enolpyruvyl-6-hydroxy-3-cyclohexene-1-carboxylate synthase